MVAAAIILIGPGRYGFDAGRGWARRPFIGSFVALLLGIGGGVAVWVLLNGANPLGLRRHSYGLGTRPPLAAVSSGSVAKVTAGSRTSQPSLRCARAHDALVEAAGRRCPPSAPCVLPNSVRAVTVSRSATVRSRTISTDDHDRDEQQHGDPRHAATSTSRPSAKNPTAKWAIGEMLMTTGFAASSLGRSHTCIIPSSCAVISLPPAPTRNLTVDQCGDYRRVVMQSSMLVVIGWRVGA